MTTLPNDPLVRQAGDWHAQLAFITETMREMSSQTDPQAMVRAYAARMRKLMPAERTVSLSRRDLSAPFFRVTRSSIWREEINPWLQRDQLPLLHGGLLADLLYGDNPVILDDVRVSDDDPGLEYLAGMRSMMAIPLFDGGRGLNMVVRMRAQPRAFDHASLPEMVWVSNLFGRATQNLVLAEEVKRAYDAVDREMRAVAAIQCSLLPARLPTVPTLDLAASYRTARRAGGDYYDFFPLPDGRWGILIADVSGHGTPAAVLMAVTHSIAHALPGYPSPPGQLLRYVNTRLASRYTLSDTFVTGFYGIYDPRARTIEYASAGHNPPRLRRSGGDVIALDGANGLPLGVIPDEDYQERTERLAPGEQIVFYTDGLTEATDPAGEQFGLGRLDATLARTDAPADTLLQSILDDVERFAAGHPPHDDCTILIARVLDDR